ncbi:MAG: ABC transporter permease [Chthoniobacterales bacterium]
MITDLKYAFRMLLKAPAFTAIAVITLALGIGANSAIYSVVDTLLLRPLPFKDPDRIVMIWGRSLDDGTARGVHSYPDYADLRDQSQSFSAMAAYTRTASILSHGDESQALERNAITSEIFAVLGVQPMLGRGYTREEDKPGAEPVVVLTHQLWKRAFGGDPRIVGQQITLSAKSVTVIGVMPPGWKFPIEDERIRLCHPVAVSRSAGGGEPRLSFP